MVLTEYLAQCLEYSEHSVKGTVLKHDHLQQGVAEDSASLSMFRIGLGILG